MRFSRSILFTVIMVLFSREVLAQPVPSREPSSTHIFPAGGRRGERVRVLVGAECIPPETSFRIWGSGISAPTVLGPKVMSQLEPSPRREPREVPICYPKEWESSIDISPTAELGPYLWRLTCARGGTDVRPFVVGDLPEFIETESNSLPERAERLDLPVTVNGRISGESDLDYYTFRAHAGEIILCDLLGGRIGSPLDAVIEISDPDGQRIAVDEMRVGSDPVLAFRSAQSGDYRLLISNISFHGGPNYVYRITLRAIANLPNASDTDLLSPLIDRELIPSIKRPSESSATSRSNDQSQLEIPSVVRGRFGEGVSERSFEFLARKDQLVTFRCRPFPIGTATLPELTLIDSSGKIVAECRSRDSSDRECRLDWTAPGDGTFRIRLRDGWIGKRTTAIGYELALQQFVPDFALKVKADSLNVLPGARVELELRALRSGFDGPIDIEVAGLPDGVRANPLQIAEKQDTAKLIIVADDSARPGDASLRIIGRAAVGTMPVERVAMAPHLGRDADGTSIGSPMVDRCFLTVQHKPVFRLFCNEAYQYAHRGTIYPYSMQIERLDGFDGEITIQLGDRQNRDLDGVEFLEIKVPPGVTDARVPIYLPESMHINVLSQSQIYAQGYARFTDKWGQPQSTLVVSEKRNMIRTMPTVVKLSAADKSLEAEAGSTIHCKLILDRSSNFQGTVDVQLVEPAVSSGFVADNARIDSGETQLNIAVKVPDRLDPFRSSTLRFRATGQLSPGVAVVSEASIPLVVKD